MFVCIFLVFKNLSFVHMLAPCMVSLSTVLPEKSSKSRQTYVLVQYTDPMGYQGHLARSRKESGGNLGKFLGVGG